MLLGNQVSNLAKSVVNALEVSRDAVGSAPRRLNFVKIDIGTMHCLAGAPVRDAALFLPSGIEVRFGNFHSVSISSKRSR